MRVDANVTKIFYFRRRCMSLWRDTTVGRSLRILIWHVATRDFPAGCERVKCPEGFGDL
jgi:hypothetical protein